MSRAIGLVLLLLASGLYADPSRAQSNVPTVNRSAVIATGGTFQTVLAAVAVNGLARRSLTIQNNNTTDSCWLYVGAGSASNGTSILLLAGGSYVRYSPYIPSDAIQATCASNNDTLYIDTQ